MHINTKRVIIEYKIKYLTESFYIFLLDKTCKRKVKRTYKKLSRLRKKHDKIYKQGKELE